MTDDLRKPTQDLLDETADEAVPKLLRSLGNSFASFIAEIDSSSPSVASYIARRLQPLAALARTDARVLAALEAIGRDGRRGEPPPVVEKAYARCVQCDAEFTQEELKAANAHACPRCGCEGLPVDPAHDISIKINTHELRILTCWADSWAAEKCNAGAQKTLKAIIERLDKQLTDTPLTLRAEVKDLQNEFPSATLIGADGQVLVPPKEPSN